jgi:hypothetical protein
MLVLQQLYSEEKKKGVDGLGGKAGQCETVEIMHYDQQGDKGQENRGEIALSALPQQGKKEKAKKDK